MARAYGTHCLCAAFLDGINSILIKCSKPTALIGGSFVGTVLYCSTGFQSGVESIKNKPECRLYDPYFSYQTEYLSTLIENVIVGTEHVTFQSKNVITGTEHLRPLSKNVIRGKVFVRFLSKNVIREKVFVRSLSKNVIREKVFVRSQSKNVIMKMVFVRLQSKNVIMRMVFVKSQSKNVITRKAFVRLPTEYLITQTIYWRTPIEFVNAQMPVVRSVRKYSTSGYAYFIAFVIFFYQLDGLLTPNRNLHYRNSCILASNYILYDNYFNQAD